MRFKKWDRGAMRGAPPGRHRNYRLGSLTPGLRTTPGNELGEFPVWTPPIGTGHARTAMEKTPVLTSTGNVICEQFDEGNSIVGKIKDRPGRVENCGVVYFAVNKVYRGRFLPK